MELAKRWKLSGGYWWLVALGHDFQNRATIHGPDREGYHHLELWVDVSRRGRQWERYAKSKNLRALKAIGRLEAARRLHV